MKDKSLRGSLLLLLGSVVWGAAFAAQRVGMEHVGPFTFNGIRMLLAGIVMIPVTAFFERKSRKAEARPVNPKEQRTAGFLCGSLLFAASSLQQVGLVSTTAGKIQGHIACEHVRHVDLNTRRYTKVTSLKLTDYLDISDTLIALFDFR